MEIEGKKIYHIPKKIFDKYVRHTLNTSISRIQNNKNLVIELNPINKTLYDIIQVSENNFWESWLESKTVIA